MPSKNRIRLQSSKEMILRIFDYRCIRCGRKTREVHEIIPISHGNRALAGVNRVPLCGFPHENNCHDWAHKVGTNISIPYLQKRRKEYLERKWKQTYARKL